MWFWKIGWQGRINFFVPSGNVKNVFYITSLSFPTQTLEPFYNILDISFVCEIRRSVYLLKNIKLKLVWKIIYIIKKMEEKSHFLKSCFLCIWIVVVPFRICNLQSLYMVVTGVYFYYSQMKYFYVMPVILNFLCISKHYKTSNKSMYFELLFVVSKAILNLSQYS